MRNILQITWSPNLAYVIGLIATDGNLSKDGRHITMRSSDLDLLETFKTCLMIKTRIAQTHNDSYAKKPCYRVQFSSAQFYRWLLKIGLFPAKTYTLGKIKIPDQYFRDFLRGHLDGDGSVFTYLDKYNFYKGRSYTNLRLYVKFISASPEHIKWLYTTLIKLTGFRAALNRRKPRDIKHASMWEIKFSKKESIKLLHWIYYEPGLPCLIRKKQLSQRILEAVSNEKRKIYTKISYS